MRGRRAARRMVVSTEWVGVSRPCRASFAAPAAAADERTARADLVGSAKFWFDAVLLAGRQHRHRRWPGRWGGCWTRAGAGSGTAPAAVGGAGRTRVTDITVVARNWTRRPGWWTWAHGSRGDRFCAFDSGGLADAVAAVKRWSAPFQRVAAVCRHLTAIPVLLDAIYDRAHTAGRRGRIGGRAGVQRAADVAASGVRAGGVFTGLPAPKR